MSQHGAAATSMSARLCSVEPLRRVAGSPGRRESATPTTVLGLGVRISTASSGESKNFFCLLLEGTVALWVHGKLIKQ
jgi:hypothetical protein